MKREKTILSLLLALSLLGIGCGSIDPTTGREKLGYAPARFYDFLDIIELNVGLDSTFSLFARAGVDPFHAGGGLYGAEKFGLDGRLFGVWKEERADVGIVVEAFTRYEKTPIWGNRYLFDAAYQPHENTVQDEGYFYERWGFSTRYLDHEYRIMDVSAEVNLIAFGVDASVSPLEFMDFVTGLFGFDVISDDDWVAPRPDRSVPLFGEKKEEPVPAEGAAEPE